MSSLLSFVITCKGRLQHLAETLPALVAQANTETIVVDYDCPDGTADWVEQHFPQARLVRVANAPFFNVACARNRGAEAAVSPWLCFVDADTRVHTEFSQVVQPLLDPRRYFQCVHGRRELMGSIMLSRQAFETIGGYDDVIEGWGGEDRDLSRRLGFAGIQAAELPVHLLETIPHPAELRTRFHQIRDIGAGWVINRMYLEAKHGMMLLSRAELSREIRAQIYAGVRQEVLAAQAEQRDPCFVLSEGWRPFVANQEVERLMTIRIRSRQS